MEEHRGTRSSVWFVNPPARDSYFFFWRDDFCPLTRFCWLIVHNTSWLFYLHPTKHHNCRRPRGWPPTDSEDDFQIPFNCRWNGLLNDHQIRIQCQIAPVYPKPITSLTKVFGQLGEKRVPDQVPQPVRLLSMTTTFRATQNSSCIVQRCLSRAPGGRPASSEHFSVLRELEPCGY